MTKYEAICRYIEPLYIFEAWTIKEKKNDEEIGSSIHVTLRKGANIFLWEVGKKK